VFKINKKHPLCELIIVMSLGGEYENVLNGQKNNLSVNYTSKIGTMWSTIAI
jgi:hypothetical protein